MNEERLTPEVERERAKVTTWKKFGDQSSLFALSSELRHRSRIDSRPEALRSCPIETRSLPTLTHCFPGSPAAAGSLIPIAPFAAIAVDLKR